MLRVLILQEYVPQYRLPFFQSLQKEAFHFGIEILVAHGQPSGVNMLRKDAVYLPGAMLMKQREWKLAGRRIVMRQVPAEAKTADLVIHEQARRNLDVYRLLLPKGQRGQVKTALWGHGHDFTKQPTWLDYRLQQKLTSAADWFFAYTEGAKNSVTRFGFDTKKITVVQNSIDTTELLQSIDAIEPTDIEEFNEKHDLLGNTALYIGALDPSKRLDFLLEAARLAASRDDTFRLLIAGDGPMRSEVQRWSDSEPFIKYLGAIGGANKSLVFACSQIIAMPGRVGLAAVDSFAAGTPIVTTNWPWHAPEFEYLQNNRNSVISPDDTHSYADAMISLLNDSPRLHGLALRAREDAQVFTLQEMVRRFLEGIRRALGVR